jgi:PAS domain S-box-containing protein
MGVSRDEQESLRSVLEGTSATTGEEFFRSLVRGLGGALHLRHVFVTRRLEPDGTRLRTLAYWCGDRFGEEFEYDAEGFACEIVLTEGSTRIAQRLPEQFPRFDRFREWGVESYLGIPVTGCGGDVLGHLAAMDARPLRTEVAPCWMLTTLARRAGAEIERGGVEEELRRSESRYRALVEQIPVVTYIAQLDQRATAVYVSPQILALTGFSQDEWCVSPSRWRRQLHPEDREAVLAQLTQALERVEPFDFEYRLLTKDDRVIWIQEHGVPVIDGGDCPVQFQGVMADVTAQKRLEDELMRSQKLDALGVLAGGVAHEFNNLLTTVLANSSLLADEAPADSKMASRVAQIRTAALRAADLTREMLAVSGKGQFVVSAIDLNHLVREMAPILRTIAKGTTELELELADEVAAVEADAGQLRQLVISLVANAAEAMEQRGGFVRLRTGSLPVEQACPEVVELGQRPSGSICSFLEVSDTGVGMDEATRRRAFDPFFSTKFAGRGLGLAAVLGIVRGHSGAIKLDSAPGAGTTVRLFFPSAEQSAAVITGELEGLAPAPGAEPKCPLAELLQGPREGKVLIVDDDEGVQEVARSMLEGAGLDVMTAGDGDEGIDLFRRHSDEISVVLLDLTMPRVGGEDVLAEMRRIDPEIRVVLMSGYTEQRVKEKFGEEALVDFLQKPFRSEELVRTLRKALDG